MPHRADHLRFVLGLKLKCLRSEQGRSLKEVAHRAGVSVSYLSEIEKGKKYPKPEKLLELADALGVPFDGLVSLQVDRTLDPVKQALGSSFVRAFPFKLFGLASNDLFALLRDAPEQAGALVGMLQDLGRRYGLQLDDMLVAALQAYQQMHSNYFEVLEQAATAFRAREGWMTDAPVGESRLRTILERRYGYRIDEETLSTHPDLQTFRSLYTEGGGPTLSVNGRLMPGQKAFIYARELGYLQLGLTIRPRTSPWVEVTSFDEVLNQFNASYFAGALLFDRERLLGDIEALFARDRWHAESLLNLLAQYRATPEMFCYRLAQLLPACLGLSQMFLLRIQHDVRPDQFRMTRILNLSQATVPYGSELSEHYCRRWPSVKLLRQLSRREHSESDRPLVRVQRSRFIEADKEFFVLSLARPLSLRRDVHTAVSLGFLIDDTFRRKVRFWDDPAVHRAEVNQTCERCPLAPEECLDRDAPASIYEASQLRGRFRSVLEELRRGSEAMDREAEA